jgi:hypothetical protein
VTARAVTPPRELASAVKRFLRLALELERVEHNRFAEQLGEHGELVKAWLSDSRCNQVPLWLLASPTCPRSVRATLVRMLDQAAGEHPAPSAHTAEAQVNVASGRLGHLLSAASEAMLDGAIDGAEARSLLPVVQRAIDTLSGLRDHLLRVVGESTPEVGDA